MNNRIILTVYVAKDVSEKVRGISNFLDAG